MKMKIIILILFCLIGFGITYCIRQYNTNIECQGEICPMPEEYKDD